MLGRFGNVITGVWLVIAPYVLNYVDRTARVTDVWIGLAVIAVALIAAVVVEGGLRFINTALGAMLVMAPFIFGYRGMAESVNDIVVGLLVMALSLVPTYRVAPRYLRRRTTVVP